MVGQKQWHTEKAYREGKKKTDVYDMKMFMQLNLSTTATLGTEKNDRRREVAVVEKFKQESLYWLSATKVAVIERWPLVEVPPYRNIHSPQT